jgi:DNA-binding MarR family transcriptional regulator
MSSNGPYTGEFIRYLFARKTLACARHRAAVAKKLDLNETDTRAIVCIAHDGEVTQAVLAERLGQTPAGTTKVVNGLVARGFVTRRNHPSDARSALVGLTPEGADVAGHAFAQLVASMDRVFAELPDDEARRHVGDFLQRVIEVSDEAATAIASDPRVGPVPRSMAASYS